MLFKKKKKLSGVPGGREVGFLNFLTSIPGVLERKPPRYDIFSEVRTGENGRSSGSEIGSGGGRGRGGWTASRGGATSGSARGCLARIQAAAKAAALSQCRLRSVLVLCFHLVLSGAE